jgi:hypothetical protein
MKITISIEDTGSNKIRVVTTPSFEQLMKERKLGHETPATECAAFAVLKILEAIKNSKKSKGIIIPPNHRNN